jgi:hypothetical protein
MNVNTLVRRIKREIGIYGIALPIDDLDGMIKDILEDTTLPVFSIYQPLEEQYQLDILDHNAVRRSVDGSDLYILPEFPGRKLLYVKRVCYNEGYLRSNSYPGIFPKNTMDTLGGLLSTTVGKNITDIAINSVTFKYIHPRRLYVYDAVVSACLTATLAFEHDRSFQSIPPTAEESFYNLAVLDVKAGLYPTIKHYDGLETSFGRIELKLDDWQSAASDRKELINNWDENYLLDAVDLAYN